MEILEKPLWPEITSYERAHHLKLLDNGEEFLEAVEKLIESAKNVIHFQMYIFADDESGNRIVAALSQAVQRNVAVYFLVDAFGSASLSPEFISRLHQEGIAFRWFGKILTFPQLSFRRRLHHKVVVVDDSRAIVGGMNIGDKFIKVGKHIPWLDFAVWVESGLCRKIRKVCEKHWQGHQGLLSLPHQGDKAHPDLKIPLQEEEGPEDLSLGFSFVRLVENDWPKRKLGVYKSYLQGICQAKESITIIGGYFLPDRNLRKALRLAAQRGVQVTLVLTSISDVPLVTLASQYIYRWPLKYNIRIFEWKSSMLHGKLAVVDKKWVTVGSYNLNELLGYGTIEMNLDIYDPAFGEEVEEKILRLIQAGCKRITLADITHSRNWFKNCLAWASYHLVKMVLKLFLFFCPRESLPPLKWPKLKRKTVS